MALSWFWSKTGGTLLWGGIYHIWNRVSFMKRRSISIYGSIVLRRKDRDVFYILYAVAKLCEYLFCPVENKLFPPGLLPFRFQWNWMCGVRSATFDRKMKRRLWEMSPLWTCSGPISLHSGSLCTFEVRQFTAVLFLTKQCIFRLL